MYPKGIRTKNHYGVSKCSARPSEPRMPQDPTVREEMLPDGTDVTERPVSYPQRSRRKGETSPGLPGVVSGPEFLQEGRENCQSKGE